jgi:protease I
MAIAGKRVACLVGDDYEDLEVWYPVLRLREAGARVDLVGLEPGEDVRGKHGYPARADRGIAQVEPREYDAVIVPGGWMPDKLRRNERVLAFCRDIDQSKKVVATICHGPWILISARILRGRTLTSTPGIRDDVENAGARWIDEAVVRDGNLISSRRPPDLPAFGKALVEALDES